jgi:Ner family transcriptional regulator
LTFAPNLDHLTNQNRFATEEAGGPIRSGHEEQPVQKQPTAWDRHAILAEIRRRFGSSRAFARQCNLTAAEISAALCAPYPKAEIAIARQLGMPVQTLWPDRYWPNGRRRTGSTRPQISGASQKTGVAADREQGR